MLAQTAGPEALRYLVEELLEAGPWLMVVPGLMLLIAVVAYIRTGWKVRRSRVDLYA